MIEPIPHVSASPLPADTLQFTDGAIDRARSIAHQGVDAVLEGSDRLRATVQRAGESTSDYVRHDPVRAVLMAVAAGALLTAVVGVLMRSRR
jgi:ElaB/YqjD/DUF883 family membrane-anchored ribosome-binding protein